MECWGVVTWQRDSKIHQEKSMEKTSKKILKKRKMIRLAQPNADVFLWMWKLGTDPAYPSMNTPLSPHQQSRPSIINIIITILKVVWFYCKDRWSSEIEYRAQKLTLTHNSVTKIKVTYQITGILCWNSQLNGWKKIKIDFFYLI